MFKAQQPLDLAGAKNKLSGFGMQLLDGIDPNPDNMVCAGIIHTQSHQVGCLMRLEPNKQAQVRNSTYSKDSLMFIILRSSFVDVPSDGSCQQRNSNARNLRFTK